MFNCFKRRDRGQATTPDQIDDVIQQELGSIRKIAIIPGHTVKSPGMLTYNDQREFQICRRVVDTLNAEIPANGKQVYKFLREEIGYRSAMKRLAQQCADAKIDLAIEFHLNAAGIPEARGCEMLILDGKDKTANVAKEIIEKFSIQFHIVRRREYKGIRGIKALKPGSRGGGFVEEMEKRGVMAMIFEPFFGDYETPDSSQFLSQPDFGVRKMADFWKKVIKEIK